MTIFHGIGSSLVYATELLSVAKGTKFIFLNNKPLTCVSYDGADAAQTRTTDRRDEAQHHWLTADNDDGALSRPDRLIVTSFG
jgi:hypothetical protein